MTEDLFAQSVIASPRVGALLNRLHAESDAQERSASQILFYISRLVRYYLFGETWGGPAADAHMRDKFVSLERDKCQALYLIARAVGATNIVEAGTSFGVSTIYLALAVSQNVEAARNGGETSILGKVIATEKERTKAARARKHWSEAGDEIEPWIDLREGDLLETLKEVTETVDLLLLDIWTPLALPTLGIIKPKMRPGSIVITDNTKFAKPLYKDLLMYLHDPKNGFKTTTLPFSGGLELSLYLP